MYQKFISILKELTVNIPLVEALEQVHDYYKFIKDLVSKKRMEIFDPI